MNTMKAPKTIGAIGGFLTAGGIIDAGEAWFGTGVSFKAFAAFELSIGMAMLGLLIGAITEATTAR